MQFKKWIFNISAGVLASVVAVASQAEIWSSTEVHYSDGDLLNPFSGKDESTSIITLQHAGGHKYGDNFFFVDHKRVKGSKTEFYGEWYSNFSLGAITGSDMSFGPVKDVGLIAGFNFAPSVSNMWLLPGVRLALDLPGFAFANLDITAYNNVTTATGANKEESSYMVDFNWAYPFKIGSTSWSIKGHMEYIAGRDVVDSLGNKQPVGKEDWILAQPQLHFDLGEAIGGEAGNLFVGIEYQYWQNKLGVKDQDESTVQLQTVWNF
jgi:nucleoside-specific outer membrane channel protein Tsx